MIIQETDTSLPLPPPSHSLSAPSLADLPNEILLTILYPFPTPDLLSVAPLNHRFAHLALKIYHARLLAASQLGGSRSLQLECYHPSLRLTAEALLCSPLGIDGLEPPNEEQRPIEQFRAYNQAFTRFKPHRRGTTRVKPRRHPAGDVPGSRTYNASNDHDATQQAPGAHQQPQQSQQNGTDQTTGSWPPEYPGDPEVEEVFQPPVKQTVNLDAQEMFTQLQTTTSLVTAGPKSGFIYSAVTASDGVVRVFRNWLSEQDQRRLKQERPEKLGNGTDRVIKRTDQGLQYVNAPAAVITEEEKLDLSDPSFLWVNDNTKPNVGVRFTVTERRWRRHAPILVQADEELAVSYEVQIEEVVIRTRHLLLVTEQGLRERQEAMGGKAIIIGSW